MLVDGFNDDGCLIGRTQVRSTLCFAVCHHTDDLPMPVQWDAPDVDPIVFLSEPVDKSVPELQVGQIRRCRIDGNSLFDLEAHPIA